MTHVKLNRLNKIYPGGRAAAVFNLNLEIESGKLHALLGPSGCGKTTTMKMIAGLLSPTSGDITFDGTSVVGVPAERRGAVMVFQNHLLFPYMSVAENVGFGLKMRGVGSAEISRRVTEILDLVHMPGIEKRRPKQLSGGQQQRVALARALIVKPKVLLLDEPLSNLDAYLRDEMRELIRGLQQTLGITTVFVTHDQEEAVVLADQIALIFDGILQQYAEPSTFYERPESKRIASFFGGVNFISGRLNQECIETEVGRLRIGPGLVTSGPATLTVRPEAIELTRDAQGENVIPARVKSHVYLGTFTRYKLAVGDLELQAVTEPESARAYHDGDLVHLRLPPDKLWVLPPEPEQRAATPV